MPAITVKISESLLAIIDDLVKQGEYLNRSDAVRDLIRRGLDARPR
jgi:Arc/MetJ-type ribon-helix-helix transcriptional regulator